MEVMGDPKKRALVESVVSEDLALDTDMRPAKKIKKRADKPSKQEQVAIMLEQGRQKCEQWKLLDGKDMQEVDLRFDFDTDVSSLDTNCLLGILKRTHAATQGVESLASLCKWREGEIAYRILLKAREDEKPTKKKFIELLGKV